LEPGHWPVFLPPEETEQNFTVDIGLNNQWVRLPLTLESGPN
jgi:hypothetical protein